MILIGRAIDYLPYFIYTFEELGKMGLGKGRGEFNLEEVKSTHENSVAIRAIQRWNNLGGGQPGQLFLFPLLAPTAKDAANLHLFTRSFGRRPIFISAP